MRRPIVRLVTVALMLALSAPLRGQQSAIQSGATFRSNVNLILVDVVVRDRSGAVVKGLTQDDFQILEDNKPQQIISFAFEQIATKPQTVETATLLAGVVKAARVPRIAATPADAPVIPVPPTSEGVSGHRLWTLLFDTSSMQPEEVQKAADSALTWVNDRMGSSDLVAVATIGSTLQVLSDFTNDKERVKAVLAHSRELTQRSTPPLTRAPRRRTSRRQRRRMPRPSTRARRSSTRSTTMSVSAP
jgi:VWFA-related protein